MSTASTGRTHDCTRPPCTNVKTTLANREPSTHDPFSDIGCTRALARSGLPDATDSNLKVVSFVGAGHRGVDWMAEPCGSCELREIDWAVPLPGPGAGRRRRVDGSRLRQITGTSVDRRVGGGRRPRFPLPGHRRGRLRPLFPARGRKPGTNRHATLTDSGRLPPGAGPVAPRGSRRIRRRAAQGRRSPPFFFPFFPFWPRAARLSWRLLSSGVPGVRTCSWVCGAY